MTVLDSECPTCGPVRSDVTDSRAYEMNGIATRMRRRECARCKQRFTTYELSPDIAQNILSEASKIDLLMGMIRQSGVDTGAVFERFLAEVRA